MRFGFSGSLSPSENVSCVRTGTLSALPTIISLVPCPVPSTQWALDATVPVKQMKMFPAVSPGCPNPPFPGLSWKAQEKQSAPEAVINQEEF